MLQQYSGRYLMKFNFGRKIAVKFRAGRLPENLEKIHFMNKDMNMVDLGQLLDISIGENGLGQISSIKTTKGFFIVFGYVYAAPLNTPVILVMTNKNEAVVRLEFGGIRTEFKIARFSEVQALLHELSK